MDSSLLSPSWDQAVDPVADATTMCFKPKSIAAFFATSIVCSVFPDPNSLTYRSSSKTIRGAVKDLDF